MQHNVEVEEDLHLPVVLGDTNVYIGVANLQDSGARGDGNHSNI